MNLKPLLFVILILGIFQKINAQDAYLISGKLYDSVGNQILAGATIKLKGTTIGTLSKDDGSFQIKTSEKLPIILIVSSIGYKTQEFIVSENGANLSLSLNTQ